MEYKRKRLICAALQKAETKRKQTARQAESAAGTEQQTPEEYDRVLRFAERIGIERGFRQEGTAASESFIPEFDERGL